MERPNDFRREADGYWKKYRSLLESVEKSPLATAREIDYRDHVQLGRQFDQIEHYNHWLKENFLNEAGNVVDLGRVPQLAYDIIAVSYGASVVPIVSSIQDIADEQGFVTFKNIRAEDTRGNVDAGDDFRDPRNGTDTYARGYAVETSNRQNASDESPLTANQMADNDGVFASGDGTAGAGTWQPLGYAAPFQPVRPGTVRAEVVSYDTAATPATRTVHFTATDSSTQDGNLLGLSVQGTVDYNTGAWTLRVFGPAPDATDPSAPPVYTGVGGLAPGENFTIEFTWGTDYEESGVAPRITTFYDQTDIRAEIIALGQELGIFKAYALNRRYGSIAETDMVSDLAAELSMEIGNTLIRRMYDASFEVPNNETIFDLTTDYGDANNSQGWSDGSINFIKAMSNAAHKMYNNIGRGEPNVILASPEVCSILDVTPGFVRTGQAYVGPHVYGVMNNNQVVIRVPNGVIPANEALLIYRGTGMFDAPSVYASFMPMFVTNTIQVPNNIFKTQGLAAAWAGMKAVMPRFTTRLRLTF